MTQFEDLVGTKPVTIEVGFTPFNNYEYFSAWITFWDSEGQSQVYQMEKIEIMSMGGAVQVDAWVTKWRNRCEIIQGTFLVDSGIFEITEGK